MGQEGGKPFGGREGMGVYFFLVGRDGTGLRNESGNRSGMLVEKTAGGIVGKSVGDTRASLRGRRLRSRKEAYNHEGAEIRGL